MNKSAKRKAKNSLRQTQDKPFGFAQDKQNILSFALLVMVELIILDRNS